MPGVVATVLSPIVVSGVLGSVRQWVMHLRTPAARTRFEAFSKNLVEPDPGCGRTLLRHPLIAIDNHFDQLRCGITDSLGEA
jgi:hypothetical protein